MTTRTQLPPPALAVLGALLLSPAASARDSLCLLGDNGKIALTTFEHRAGGSSRATEITLIYGLHLLRGRLRDTDSGPITLTETGQPGGINYKFVGTLKVDYTPMKMTLKGKLKYTPTLADNYNTTFHCKQLQP